MAALKTAMRLSPRFPTWYTYSLAKASLWLGNFAGAHEAAKTYLWQEPDEPYACLFLALVCQFQHRSEEAAAMIAKLPEKHPAFGMRSVLLSQRCKEREKLDRVINMLRKAGLPE